MIEIKSFSFSFIFKCVKNYELTPKSSLTMFTEEHYFESSSKFHWKYKVLSFFFSKVNFQPANNLLFNQKDESFEWKIFKYCVQILTEWCYILWPASLINSCLRTNQKLFVYVSRRFQIGLNTVLVLILLCIKSNFWFDLQLHSTCEAELHVQATFEVCSLDKGLQNYLKLNLVFKWLEIYFQCWIQN